jgi:hypothetical protein
VRVDCPPPTRTQRRPNWDHRSHRHHGPGPDPAQLHGGAFLLAWPWRSRRSAFAAPSSSPRRGA